MLVSSLNFTFKFGELFAKRRPKCEHCIGKCTFYSEKGGRKGGGGGGGEGGGGGRGVGGGGGVGVGGGGVYRSMAAGSILTDNNFTLSREIVIHFKINVNLQIN